ncbi:MAG: TMEM175 family protein [Pseudobdellovibrio sp.]
MSPINKLDLTNPVRLNALCDGVFAIAMTLLVLELRIPDSPNILTSEQFMALLNAMAPSLTSYLISFFVIGVYWSIHNRISNHMLLIDRQIVRQTFFLLLGVSLLPLTTQIQGKYGYLGLSTSLYALNVALCGLASFKIWSYCLKNPEHISPHTSPEMRELFKWRLLVAPLVFMASIPISFVNTSWARYFWVLCYLSTSISKFLHRVLSGPKS